jgi:hypothetical protein
MRTSADMEAVDVDNFLQHQEQFTHAHKPPHSNMDSLGASGMSAFPNDPYASRPQLPATTLIFAAKRKSCARSSKKLRCRMRACSSRS